MREEAMPAEIEPETVAHHGARQPADGISAFQHLHAAAGLA